MDAEGLNLWRRLVLWMKMAHMYGSRKSERVVVFDLEHVINDL